MAVQDDTETADGPALPPALPVFPLAGVLLLPGGQLPLHIFEPRYIAMIGDALRSDRLIGMIQPRFAAAEDDPAPPLFGTGCAGRITAFEETGDGRYLITLTGLSRFRAGRELAPQNGYRRIEADWLPYEADRRGGAEGEAIGLDRGRLRALLAAYFGLTGMSCDWEAIDGAPDGRLLTCLAMACPLNPGEKQALLEAPCGRTRASMFMAMLDMAIREKGGCGECH